MKLFRFVVLACCLLAGLAHAQPDGRITVATYNLRLDTPADGPDAWPQRRAAVQALIRYHGFDLFGTQEGLPNQIADLETMGEYARVGAGRDDGKEKGEHSAIFYRRSRFTLQDKGDFWLSETPDRPSLGWDATCCNRIASWARLRDRATGIVFTVFCAHFDHQGEVARRESARLMLRKIAGLAGKGPVLFLGDLNSTPETEQARTLQAALQDARLASAAPPYGPVGTFNGFRADAPLLDRIDYIFVSAGVKVLDYAALTDTAGGRWPSDHLPVVAHIRMR